MLAVDFLSTRVKRVRAELEHLKATDWSSTRREPPPYCDLLRISSFDAVSLLSSFYKYILETDWAKALLYPGEGFMG